mmetsp:Transcript_24898/g.25118  ORF Transcript_24898/g.25118 Transcript_24898/m.25118 type:complete len:294 (-) Transcript_24898:177-1058(-)
MIALAVTSFFFLQSANLPPIGLSFSSSASFQRSICRKHSSKHTFQLSASTLDVATGVENPYYRKARRDSWNFASRPFETGLNLGVEESIQEAFDGLPSGSLPNVCIMQISSELASKLPETSWLPIFKHILSHFISVETIVGTVIDDPSQQTAISVTMGALQEGTVKPFHISEDTVETMNHVPISPESGKPSSSPVNFILFPHSSTSPDSLNTYIQSMRSGYPDTFITGSFLSANTNPDTSSAFIVERGFPSSSIRFYKSGIVGLAVASDLTPLRAAWPAWKQSLVPMLRWATF